MGKIYSWPELLASQYRARSPEPGDRLNIYYSAYASDNIKSVVDDKHARAVLRIISHIYPAPTEMEVQEMGRPSAKHVSAGTLILVVEFEDVQGGGIFTAAGFGLDAAPDPRYVCAHERHANQIICY